LLNAPAIRFELKDSREFLVKVLSGKYATIGILVLGIVRAWADLKRLSLL
jgi:hypothetical protein